VFVEEIFPNKFSYREEVSSIFLAELFVVTKSFLDPDLSAYKLSDPKAADFFLLSFARSFYIEATILKMLSKRL